MPVLVEVIVFVYTVVTEYVDVIVVISGTTVVDDVVVVTVAVVSVVQRQKPTRPVKVCLHPGGGAAARLL